MLAYTADFINDDALSGGDFFAVSMNYSWSVGCELKTQPNHLVVPTKPIEDGSL